MRQIVSKSRVTIHLIFTLTVNTAWRQSPCCALHFRRRGPLVKLGGVRVIVTARSVAEGGFVWSVERAFCAGWADGTRGWPSARIFGNRRSFRFMEFT